MFNFLSMLSHWFERDAFLPAGRVHCTQASGWLRALHCNSIAAKTAGLPERCRAAGHGIRIHALRAVRSLGHGAAMAPQCARRARVHLPFLLPDVADPCAPYLQSGMQCACSAFGRLARSEPPSTQLFPRVGMIRATSSVCMRMSINPFLNLRDRI